MMRSSRSTASSFDHCRGPRIGTGPPAARKRRPEERKDVRARSGSGLKLDGIDADADGGPAGKLDDLSE